MIAQRSSGRQTSRQRGFSTLEAIVAVTLIAITFLPLLALQGQLLRTSVVVVRAEDNLVAMKSALAQLRVTNPMREPEGTARVGTARLVWKAEPVTPELPVRSASGAASRFVTRLYRIEARLIFENRSERTFQVDLVGWRSIAPPGDTLGSG